ncbi:MAG: rpsI, partial [Solirubrobacterales bacterium]|nr:rpsI [Solirubrobacterales bacterium]
MAADEHNPESNDSEQQGGEQTPEAGAAAAPDAGSRAVPTEDAKEIAAEVEDAPLEAVQEQGSKEAPQPATVEPGGEGHAVPGEEAMEIAGVAEDAPLEAAQEAQDRAAEAAAASEEDEDSGATPRVKPSVPGAHLEVDIVPEGADPLGRSSEGYEDPYAVEEESDSAEQEGDEERDGEALVEPIATATIDLASGARYRATGKRKTAIARVTLRPGSGTYLINGRALEAHFPRETLQRNIRQ